METTIIKIVGVVLAIASPLALMYSLKSGMDLSNLQNSKKRVYLSKLYTGILAWTALMFVLTLSGIFEYQAGDLIPRFIVGLFVPVLIMIALFGQSWFRTVLDSIPLHVLVGSQFFRLFGAVFFLIAMTGMGPTDFMSSGYGDVLTGTLAIIASLLAYRKMNSAKPAMWIFTLVGVLDLANVSRILLANYPIWSNAEPSTGFAGSFPMMLVLSITAPVALILHIYTIRALMNPAEKHSKLAV